MDLAAYITWQCFVWSALITCVCLPACEKTRMYRGRKTGLPERVLTGNVLLRTQVFLSLFEKVLEYIDSNI